MYRSDLDTKDKGGAIMAVAAIHAALGLALLHMSGTVDLTNPQDALQVFDITEVQPPPPEPPPPPRQEQKEKPKEKEGGSAPKNIKSEPTPVVAPKPKQLPTRSEVVAAEKPAQGSAPTQGASDVRGAGTGAGGTGTGTGSGGSGSGPGGGGGGGVAVPPGLVRGITNRDYPVAVQRAWPRGGRIFLRLRIQPNGRPSQCDVMRSFGDSATDQWTCRLIMERGLFRPARDAQGVRIAAWFGYVQSETGRFER